MPKMGSGLLIAAMAGAMLAGATAQAPTPLPPLPDFSHVALRLWDWDAPMAPSQWSEPKLGGYDWRADHAVIRDGELVLSVSERASGQVQTQAAASGATEALWEVDVTLPSMRDGLIAAPLWTFNAKTFDEIDFEVVGRNGLQLTLWTAVDGKHTAVWSDTVIRGDLSGRRFRLAIAYEAGRRVRFFVDGAVVADVTPKDTPLGFPSTVQKPYFDLWVANGLDPGWAGKWRPLSRGESLRMRVHGYRAGPLPPA